MSPEPAPKRPFTSVTRAECFALFLAAYGYEPAKIDKFTPYTIAGGGTVLYITDDLLHLVVYSDGSIASASPDERGRSLSQKFDARKLITHIDTLKLQFGSDQADTAEGSPSTSVQS